jgi:hypothetical protein
MTANSKELGEGERTMIGTRRKLVSVALGAAITALCTGCADISMPQVPTLYATPSGNIPRVEDCVQTNVGTPSKFVCGGKSYTSYQLAKLRVDEAKKYESGK